MYPKEHRTKHPGNDEAHMAGLFHTEKVGMLSISYKVRMEQKPITLLHTSIVHEKPADPWFRKKKIGVNLILPSIKHKGKTISVAGEVWYSGLYIESPRNGAIPVLELSNPNHMLTHDFWLQKGFYTFGKHLVLLPSSTIIDTKLFMAEADALERRIEDQQRREREARQQHEEEVRRHLRAEEDERRRREAERRQQQNEQNTIALSEWRRLLEEIAELGEEEQEDEERPLEETLQELLNEETRSSAAGGRAPPPPPPKPTKPPSMPQHIVNGYLEALFEKKEECPISCEPLTKEAAVLTACGHALSRLAAERWMSNAHSCPVCRLPCEVKGLQMWKAA
jgi:flagellar biosynthesis GTPase FlhF